MLVIGNYGSPYVRKVLACLHLKGLSYEIDPMLAFYGDARFEALSPLRRIPVLVDGDVAIADSTVICEYLEERYPEVPILPADPAKRARARWLEEYADTRMGDVFIWGLFYPLAVTPAVWEQKGDKAKVAQTLETDAPAVLDYLESQLPADGFLFGSIGVADVAIASFFRNAAWVRFTVDAQRWPKTAAFVARVLDHPAVAGLRPFEDACVRNPIAQHRTVLSELGAPLSAETFGTETKPTRGAMTV